MRYAGPILDEPPDPALNQIQTVQAIAAACLCVTGVSHWLHPRTWCAFFAQLAERGEAGAFANGLLHAGVGAFFVALHPVWTGLACVLTYWACAMFAKGLLYLLAPHLGLSSMRALTPERAERMRWVGLPMVALGLLAAVCAFL